MMPGGGHNGENMNCYCNGLDDSCPLCRGTGQLSGCTTCDGLRWVAKLSGDNEYEAEPCPRCAYKVLPELGIDIGLTQEMLGWTFANMTTDYPELLQVAEAIKRVIERKRGWVVMTTHSGSGKSYLLACAVNAAVVSGIVAKYVQFSTLMTDFIESRMSRHEKSFPAIMREHTGVGLLALDEFGEGNLSDFLLTVTREMLVGRSDTAGWTPTLFATNKDPAFFKQKMPWLFDRFHDDEVERYNLATVPSLRGRL